MNEDERQERTSEIEDLYIDFQHEYKRALAKRRREAEQLADEDVIEARKRLSQACHEAHADGLPWQYIRGAVKKLSDASGFAKIRDAYQPEEKVDLRSKSVADPEEAPKFRWVGDGTLEITGPEGELLVVEGARIEDDSPVFDNYQVFVDNGLYTHVVKIVEEALNVQG